MGAVLIYLFFMFVWLESSHLHGVSNFFYYVNVPIWIIILGCIFDGCTGANA